MNHRHLKVWRKAKGLSQDKAAAVFGVSPRTYKNWELDAHPLPGPAEWALRLMIKHNEPEAL